MGPFIFSKLDFNGEYFFLNDRFFLKPWKGEEEDFLGFLSYVRLLKVQGLSLEITEAAKHQIDQLKVQDWLESNPLEKQPKLDLTWDWDSDTIKTGNRRRLHSPQFLRLV